MKKNDGIMLAQSLKGDQMLFLNTYQNTANIEALTDQLFYVLDGTMTLLYQAKKYTLFAGDIFFIPKNEVILLTTELSHALTYVISSTILTDSSRIYCNSAAGGSHYDDFRSMIAEDIYQMTHATDNLESAMEQHLRRIPDMLSSHFWGPSDLLTPDNLSGASTQSDSKYQIFLRDVMDEINHNYKKRITLNQLAKKYHFSPSYLSRLFLKETGLHFNDYLANLRLAEAISQLVFTSKSVNEIAEQSGFADNRAFLDAFKRANGVSPSTYRKQVSGESKQGIVRYEDNLRYVHAQGYFDHLFLYRRQNPSVSATPPVEHYEKRLDVGIPVKRSLSYTFTAHVPQLRLLQTEQIRIALRTMKKKIGLTSVAFPVWETELPELYQVTDFLADQGLTAILLLDPSSLESFGAHLTPLLTQRYLGLLTFEIQNRSQFRTSGISIPSYLEMLPNHFMKDTRIQALYNLQTLSDALITTEGTTNYLLAEFVDAPAATGPTALFHGRPGLFAGNGTAKTTFGCLRLFASMTGPILHQEPGLLITGTAQECQILLWHLPSNELPQSPEQLNSYYTAAGVRQVTLTLEHLSGSLACIISQRYFPEVPDAYEQWLSIGTSTTMTWKLEQELDSRPQMRQYYQAAPDNTLTLRHTLEACEICQLTIRMN